MQYGIWLMLGIGVLPVLFATHESNAATLIESKAPGGVVNMIWLDGGKMRAKDGAESGYMLFNAGTKKMYSISPDTREAIDMSENIHPPQGADVKKTTHIELVCNTKGKGPVIAGYETEIYEILANGKKCGEEYLSKKALEDVGSIEAFDALAKLDATPPQEHPEEKADPCLLMSDRIGDQYRKYGLPLRGIDPDGEMNMEVVRIVRDAPLPTGGFDLPPDFRVVTLNQLMEEDAKVTDASHPDTMSANDINSEEMQKKVKEMQNQINKNLQSTPASPDGTK